MGGKGGSSFDLKDIKIEPTEEEKLLQQAATRSIDLGNESFLRSRSLTDPAIAQGLQALVTGTATPNQTPGLQRSLNTLKRATAQNRQSTIDRISASRLANTPFGLNILAGLDANAGVQQNALVDQFTQNLLQRGFAASGQSGQLGSAFNQTGIGGLGSLVGSQANRFGASAGFLGQQAQSQNALAASNASVLGSGIGSLLGTGLGAASLFAGPAAAPLAVGAIGAGFGNVAGPRTASGSFFS